MRSGYWYENDGNLGAKTQIRKYNQPNSLLKIERYKLDVRSRLILATFLL